MGYVTSIGSIRLRLDGGDSWTVDYVEIEDSIDTIRINCGWELNNSTASRVAFV